MSPASDRITQGLFNASEGIADLRQELEVGAKRLAERRSNLVDAEFRLRGLALQAMRARLPRHLQPSEDHGKRRKDRDGMVTSPPKEITDEKDYWHTHESLEKMGLAQHANESTPDRMAKFISRIIIR